MARQADTRTRMVQAAKSSFRHHGLAATGFTEILEKADAPRGVIYHHFPRGKTELAEAVVHSAAADISALIDELVQSSQSVAGGIASFVDVCVLAIEETGGGFGCPISPVVLDAPELPTVLAAADEAFRGWADRIAGALEQEGVDPELARQASVTAVAAIEGGLMLSRAAGSSRPMREVGDGLALLLASMAS